MCLPGQPPAPASAADAMAMTRAGLAWLAAAEATSLTSGEQADCLRALEQAVSMHTAARASVLRAFAAAGGYEEDGQGSAKTWLRWQTQITGGAAAAAMAWMRRLSAHPAVRDALAAAAISAPFARQICDWTDELPPQCREDADAILLAAAAGGAELSDLAAVAEEMRKRTARPDPDGRDDGFADRWVRLDSTFRGTGSLGGTLTPACNAALGAVLESLGKKHGPEDTRTKGQRDHDALEEACRRLIAAGCLPDRAGQPTQVQLHMTLDQLRGRDTGSGAEDAWAAERASQPGWLDGPGAEGEACDASIVPVVSGHVDPGVLDRLAAALLHGTPPAEPGTSGTAGAADRPGAAGTPGATAWPGAAAGLPAAPGTAVPGAASRPGAAGAPGAARAPMSPARWRRAERAARQLLLRAAADLLSGPAGLAVCLRTGALDGLVASVSLPLDIGAAADTIPAHLRRAVTARDRHCRFPGCHQPPAACHPHHLIPRAHGGRTSLAGLLLLCSFHHLIAVHRWGWGITLHPDGTTTATSPDGKRTLHSHGPPARAA